MLAQQAHKACNFWFGLIARVLDRKQVIEQIIYLQ